MVAGALTLGACTSTVDGSAAAGDSTSSPVTTTAPPAVTLDEDLVDPDTGIEFSITEVELVTVDDAQVALVTLRLRNRGDTEVDPADLPTPELIVAGGQRTATAVPAVAVPVDGPVPPGATRTAVYGFVADDDELSEVTVIIGEVNFTGDVITVFAPTHVTVTAAPPPPAEPAPTTAAPPIGYTGAPVGPPQPLHGKTIAECMVGDYQPGTTLFTDGTTGWTEECAP